MKLVVPGARNDAKPAPSLIRLLLRAFAIQDRLEQNPDLTLQQIAEAEGVSPSYVTRLLRLAYLAPDIVTAIIDGRQPPGLTAENAHEETPVCRSVGKPRGSGSGSRPLNLRSIPSRPVLSLDAGRRELRQPFWTSKRRTTEKGLRDDGAETARHTATTRLFQWRSIAKVPVNA